MSNLLLRTASAALVLGPLALAILAGGCGPSTTANICEALCTCSPCTDGDRADCKDSADAAQQQAAGACAAPFDAYLTCAEDNVRCHEPQALNTRCIGEISAVIRCDPTLQIIGSPCAAASIKTAICLGTDVPGTSNQTCVGTQACVAQCTIAATCAQVKDVFTGTSSGVGQPLVDCFNGCSQSSGG